MSAELVSEPGVYSIINTDLAQGAVDEISVTDASQVQIGLLSGTGYLATVISELGSGIRSGPGFEYELVATKPLGQQMVYMAQSKNGGEWLLLEDGNWISTLHVSTQGIDRTFATAFKSGPPAEGP